MKTNHEQVLGVRQGASTKEIEQAYKKWLRAYNPNREKNADERWAKQEVRRKIDRSYLALIEGRGGNRRASH
jgi:DnaJ-class molecular chaperone